MTTESQIDPERVTKPIRLLAAWLVGLILVDSSFLLAATQLSGESWERGVLIIASVVNVPLFLFALFMLQTRFRPELQEDSYYSQYLDKRTNQIVTIGRAELIEKELVAIRTELKTLTVRSDGGANGSSSQEGTWARVRIGLNKMLADFTDVRAALKRERIPLDDIFGTDEAPLGRTMAISGRLPMSATIQALQLAIKLNLSGYSYFDPEGEGLRQDILIGAYGGDDFPVTPELVRILDDLPERADLRAYESEHRVKDAQKSVVDL